MMEPKLKVEKARAEDLVPYANNAKIHSAEQIEQIAASIEHFGFCDPVGVWTRSDGQMEIVEGHGRIMAANLLGIDEVPIIRLDHLDDDARRAYVHIHNQTTLSSGFDYATLDLDLADIPGFDWGDFGFGSFDGLGTDGLLDGFEDRGEKEKTTVTCPRCGERFEI